MLFPNFCFVCLFFIHQSSTFIIETKIGTIIGNKKYFKSSGINVYLGIPYAEPPIDEKRFEKPVRLTKLPAEPFIANKLGNHCYQTPVAYRNLTAANISEDCLHLNVWTPSSCNPKQLYPIMFYIYGGSFIMGSISAKDTLNGDQILLDGSSLVAHGNVIVVTVNYRIGPFGYLYVDGKISGNQAFWDQNLALKWVHENIHNFCGDASSITIFGNSAGSMSVGMHLTSSYSTPLFQNAIMQSGAAPVHPIFPESKARGSRVGTELARSVNCLTKTNTVDIDCMKRVPASIINKKSNSIEGFWPVEDDIFLSSQVVDMYKNEGKLLIPSNKNLLIGLNQNEGDTFVAEYFGDEFGSKSKILPQISKSRAKQLIKDRLPKSKVKQSF